MMQHQSRFTDASPAGAHLLPSAWRACACLTHCAERVGSAGRTATTPHSVGAELVFWLALVRELIRDLGNAIFRFAVALSKVATPGFNDDNAATVVGRIGARVAWGFE